MKVQTFVPKFHFLFTSVLAVTSTVLPRQSQCTDGSLQCCNAVESASSAAGMALLTLLGVDLEDPNLVIGLGCSPITGQGSWYDFLSSDILKVHSDSIDMLLYFVL